MSDIIQSILTIQNADRSDEVQVFDFVATPESLFDFNKICYMPKKYRGIKTQWFEQGGSIPGRQRWCRLNWGPNFNAFQIKRELVDGRETLFFATHNFAPFPLIKKLSLLFPEFVFVLKVQSNETVKGFVKYAGGCRLDEKLIYYEDEGIPF